MKSGNPDPLDDLRLIIETKRHVPTRTLEIVSGATRWLKAVLDGAEVQYHYASCEDQDHYGFGAFVVTRSYRGRPVRLELKVAEIRDTPYIFADVRSLGPGGGNLFPFFGDIGSENGRELLLHYIADFVMSSEA